jgi:hypothetical protein
VTGGNLAEVAPTTTAGRSFRRFLAQNVPEAAQLRIDVPFTLADARSRYFFAVAAVCALAMAAAIVIAARRRRVTAPAVAVPTHRRETDELLQAITALDMSFERDGDATPDERARYDAERARLKARLASALAEEDGPR